MLPGGVAVNSVQFEMESWTGAQRAFAVKSFYKNNGSYVAAQREFRKKFGIHRNSKVPSAHAINTWVNNFEETGSIVKKKGGSVKKSSHHTEHQRCESIIRTKSSPIGCASFQETGMMCCVFFYVLCYVSRPLIHLFLQMLKYVLPYKFNSVMISNTLNFFNTYKSPDSLADPV